MFLRNFKKGFILIWIMNHTQDWDYDIKLFIINNHNSTTSSILSIAFKFEFTNIAHS